MAAQTVCKNNKNNFQNVESPDILIHICYSVLFEHNATILVISQIYHDNVVSKFLTKIVYYLYLALCKKACQNGGFCYDSNKCNCKSGWSGSTCNIGKIISTLPDPRSQSNVCACTSFCLSYQLQE